MIQVSRRSVAAILFFLYAPISIAFVDMKNANYSDTRTDLVLDGTGYDLKVVRTYNSKSLFDGIFGYGWCSDFETSLQLTAEGNIKLTECGAGQELYFTPREFGAKDIEKTIAQILPKIKAAKKADEATLKKLAEDMKSDHDLRAMFAFSYKVAVPIKEGTSFFANGREVERVEFAKGVYTRVMPDGSFMRFDKDGKLTHMYDRNGNFVKLEYAKEKLARVVDNNGRQLVFKLNPAGKVESVVGPNKLQAEYKYNPANELISVKDAVGGTYTYAYDEQHNMLSATFPDKTTIAIKYDTKKDWVVGFTDRDKCSEEYKYESNPRDPKMHYWSIVTKTCKDRVVHEARHEFWYKKRKDDQVYLQKAESTVNGMVSEINYHEVFGKPVSIRRNSETYTYDYYDNGQIKTKSTRISRQNFKYDPKSSKVSEVLTETINNLGRVVATRKTIFRYDPKGSLIYAENSDGFKVSMTYDSKGRITSILDQAKKLVQLEYEERFGKPAKIQRPGLGVLSITYKPNGEIEKADSPDGPTVAKQVASTFNNLMEVISPANAEIYN